MMFISKVRMLTPVSVTFSGLFSELSAPAIDVPDTAMVSRWPRHWLGDTGRCSWIGICHGLSQLRNRVVIMNHDAFLLLVPAEVRHGLYYMNVLLLSYHEAEKAIATENIGIVRCKEVDIPSLPRTNENLRMSVFALHLALECSLCRSYDVVAILAI
ncbi:hypothetical protein B0H34DRAFT_7290 [Crassisporium funariophilum]|nr:hypothetical protein B0H34DRAFT_7290 [Crassisporium funariophilum]